MKRGAATPPPPRSRKTLRPRTLRRRGAELTHAIAEQLGLADRPQLELTLDTKPRRRGYIRASTCRECKRRGYHLARCSRSPKRQRAA